MPRRQNTYSKFDFTFIDLFSGCGGFSTGLEQAGWKCLAGLDNNENAINTFSANHSSETFALVKDLTKFSPSELSDLIDTKNLDLIIGGPPCQDFSIAGYRNWGDRANLTIRFAEIISTIKPKWFVMENVYNIERMPVLPMVIRIFLNAGYGITQRILEKT